MRLRVHFGFLQYTVTLLVVFSQGAERLETGLSAKPRTRYSCQGVHKSECSLARRIEAGCEASKPVVEIASGAVPVDRMYPGAGCRNRFPATQPRQLFLALCSSVRRTLRVHNAAR